VVAALAGIKVCGAGPPDRASEHSDSDDDLYHACPFVRMISSLVMIGLQNKRPLPVAYLSHNAVFVSFYNAALMAVKTNPALKLDSPQ
jgi:hypothetical protein